MNKTVCELFAGVGGFRCGLNNIKSIEDNKEEKWETVWFSQWEPAEKKTQYAHSCYVYRFGTCLDKDGNDTTNWNIELVDKKKKMFDLYLGNIYENLKKYNQYNKNLEQQLEEMEKKGTIRRI